MRHHLDQIGPTILAVQHGIEAQPTTTVMRLAGTLATQITPDFGTRKSSVVIAAQLPGDFDSVE